MRTHAEACGLVTVLYIITSGGSDASDVYKSVSKMRQENRGCTRNESWVISDRGS